MTRNKIGHVSTTNIPKLRHVFIVDPSENANFVANSRSIILRSEDNYKKYWMHKSYEDLIIVPEM